MRDEIMDVRAQLLEAERAAAEAVREADELRIEMESHRKVSEASE